MKNQNQNKTPKQYASSGKGWIIAFVILFILAVVLVAQKSCTAQTGYMVAIENQTGKIEITKTPNIADVYALASKHIPGNCANFNRELTKSVYYTIENQQTQFYVEVKRITKNGKYRRLSNREFAKLNPALTSSQITINHNQSPSITINQ